MHFGKSSFPIWIYYMDLTSKYVADRLGGTLEGDPNVKITSVARIENGKAGAISFLANPKY